MNPRISSKALIKKDGRVLVTVNRDRQGEYYLLPGGGQRPFETLKDALVREVKEEVGAEVTVNDVVGIREYMPHGEPPHHHKVEIIFACALQTSPSTADRSADLGQQGWRWIEVAALPMMRFFPQSLAEMLNDSEEHPIYMGVTEWC